MKKLYAYRLTLLGILLGAIAGYWYYHSIGCASGTCAITSKPFNSTVYGAIMGGLLFSMFQNNQTSGNQKKRDII